jgi:hypothetical protein
LFGTQAQRLPRRFGVVPAAQRTVAHGSDFAACSVSSVTSSGALDAHAARTREANTNVKRRFMEPPFCARASIAATAGRVKAIVVSVGSLPGQRSGSQTIWMQPWPGSVQMLQLALQHVCLPLHVTLPQGWPPGPGPASPVAPELLDDEDDEEEEELDELPPFAPLDDDDDDDEPPLEELVGSG